MRGAWWLVRRPPMMESDEANRCSQRVGGGQCLVQKGARESAEVQVTKTGVVVRLV